MESRKYSFFLGVIFITVSPSLFSQDSIFSQVWNPRISLQTGGGPVSEGTITNYQVSAGYVSSNGMISANLYMTFDNYDYQHYGTTEDFQKISATGILPTIKLFRFLFFGYGYLSGTEHRLYLAGMQDTLEFYNRKYSQWTTFYGIDIDLYVYREFYITFGLYMKQPAPYVAIGLSKRF
jgi:hypothetical protein